MSYAGYLWNRTRYLRVVLRLEKVELLLYPIAAFDYRELERLLRPALRTVL